MVKGCKRKKELVERGPRLLLPPVVGHRFEKVLLQSFVAVEFSITENAVERCSVRLRVTNMLLQHLLAVEGPVADAAVEQRRM